MTSYCSLAEDGEHTQTSLISLPNIWPLHHLVLQRSIFSYLDLEGRKTTKNTLGQVLGTTARSYTVPSELCADGPHDVTVIIINKGRPTNKKKRCMHFP